MNAIHSETLSRASQLAARAARPYPHATRKQLVALRDEFVSRITDRLASKVKKAFN
jgi:hypothetical protein